MKYKDGKRSILMLIFALFTEDVRIRSLRNPETDEIWLDTEFSIDVLSHIRPLEIEKIISKYIYDSKRD
jgi:hypothetical protein